MSELHVRRLEARKELVANLCAHKTELGEAIVHAEECHKRVLWSIETEARLMMDFAFEDDCREMLASNQLEKFRQRTSTTLEVVIASLRDANRRRFCASGKVPPFVERSVNEENDMRLRSTYNRTIAHQVEIMAAEYRRLDPKATFAANLKALIRESGWTVEQFAEYTDISRRQLFRHLKGALPTADHLAEIARTLDEKLPHRVTVSDLFKVRPRHSNDTVEF